MSHADFGMPQEPPLWWTIAKLAIVTLALAAIISLGGHA